MKKRQEEAGVEDVDMSDVLDGFAQKARDHARVPMQVSALISDVFSRPLQGTTFSGRHHQTLVSRQEILGCVSMKIIRHGTSLLNYRILLAC